MQSSWIPIASDSDFSLGNLPYGIFRSAQSPHPQAATRLGDQVISLAALHRLGYLDAAKVPPGIFEKATLNEFISLGKEAWQRTRSVLQSLFHVETLLPLRNETAQHHGVFFPATEVEMQMPVFVRDYTDFYASEYHATNVGRMFRGADNALMPNWKHLPVGYHGRASSIVVSGTPIRRPMGQIKPSAGPPTYGPSRRLDFELEVAWIIGKETELGEQVPISAAEDHIFGLVLFNDWSARDIQRWEYVPLGPFLGKSFGSTMSPWIVPLAALEPFRVEGPVQTPAVLPYLHQPSAGAFDLNLEVSLVSQGGEATVISRSNFHHVYWSMAQMIAHHTINGCNLHVGDLMASGTISGPTPDAYGSLLEMTVGGKRPLTLRGGAQRAFLEDHDTVIMRGYGTSGELRVGFGEASGQVLPSVGISRSRS